MNRIILLVAKLIATMYRGGGSKWILWRLCGTFEKKEKPLEWVMRLIDLRKVSYSVGSQLMVEANKTLKSSTGCLWRNDSTANIIWVQAMKREVVSSVVLRGWGIDSDHVSSVWLQSARVRGANKWASDARGPQCQESMRVCSVQIFKYCRGSTWDHNHPGTELQTGVPLVAGVWWGLMRTDTRVCWRSTWDHNQPWSEGPTFQSVVLMVHEYVLSWNVQMLLMIQVRP